MALYQFECLKCKKEYEEFSSYDESGKYPKVTCPHCNSKRKNRVVSGCAFNFTNPVGTDRWHSEKSGHDYRYKHNLPNVQRERQLAQRASHMGPQPYTNIDDISSGNHFGDVE